MPAPVKPGESFGGYTIESELGRGGMGTVYLAVDRKLVRKVALKLIAAELADDEGFRARFLRESQLAASLDHPNVIPVYEADEVDGAVYLAMRYVRGASLQAAIRERGPLSLEETLRVGSQIGGALDAAHAAGLVHRDVKPANILISEPDGHAYLCDFGLARRTSTDAMTQPGSFLGTVDYCAPEQIQGLPVDGRADVYSLGCVLFHCLAGRPPFVGDTDFAVLSAHVSRPAPRLSDVRSDLPASLDEVLATAMAKDRDARYAAAGDLVAAFRSAAAGETRTAPTVPVPTAPQQGRRRVWLAAGAVAAVLAIGGVIGGLLATRGGPGGGNEAALRTFVDRVENMLEQSAAGRGEVSSAISAGFRCSIPAREAARRIASVADNRQSVLDQLGNLDAPTDEASRSATLLQRALQHSIEADRHYRDGFLSVTTPVGKCPLPANPAFDLARRSDRLASSAKVRFVAAFDPLADRFHRRLWSADQI